MDSQSEKENKILGGEKNNENNQKEMLLLVVFCPRCVLLARVESDLEGFLFFGFFFAERLVPSSHEQRQTHPTVGAVFE